MTPEISTVIIDGPHATPYGGQMTRIVVLNEDGQEIGWLSVDAAGFGYDATAEHPDREFLGWPEGIDGPYSLYNNCDEGWSAPSYEDALFAALYEHAVRLDEGWYADNDVCRLSV